jgi:pimeloyl-CoA dehydrogenase
MDLYLSKSQSDFQSAVRSFIDEQLPSALRRKMRIGHSPTRQEIVDWHRTLNKQGWAAPHWPIEYGGAGLGLVERVLLEEALYRTPAPQPLAYNVTLLGPVLLKYGTKEQLLYWMPKLANLDVWFCQGFSEPGAGSDLASLKTSAVRRGESYVVNGQKIWTTSAHWADWIFCLVRTSREDRKHDGISMLLIDLKSPGVTVRPIRSIDGAHHLNEVFFDDVCVQADNLVGQEGRGWGLTKFMLSNERVLLGRIGNIYERLDRARELLPDAALAAASKQRVKERIAILEAEARALEMIRWRMVAQDSLDPRAATLGSIVKIKGSELLKEVALILLQLGSHDGVELMTASNSGRFDRSTSAAAPQYFYTQAATIFGGSTEIQRELISREVF